MNAASSESLLLRSGRSQELGNVLKGIEELEAADGPKFTPAACRELGRLITCRIYASAILELGHLIQIARLVEGGTRYEGLFWESGSARPGHFKHYLTSRLFNTPPGLEVTFLPNGLALTYPDGAFTVTFGRMPVLSALLEFSLTALGYGELDDLFGKMLSAPPSRKGVSQTADALSRKLYAYLGEHLPSAQNQRKLRRLIAFMEEIAGEHFAVEEVTDQAIVDFWLGESTAKSDDGVDFKTFHAVFIAFANLIQSLVWAKSWQGFDHANAIGQNHELGEVEPDTENLDRWLDGLTSRPNPLELLNEAPADEIKFFTQREHDFLSALLEVTEASRQVPLSVIRDGVFKEVQSRLTQALRRKISGDERQRLIDTGPVESYEERHQRLKKLRDQLQKVRLAGLHVLIQNRSPAAIDHLLPLLPDFDWSSLALDFSGLTDRDGESSGQVFVVNRFLSILDQTDKVGKEPAQLASAAKKAFGSLNRQGFDGAGMNQPDRVEGFTQGLAALNDLDRTLGEFLDRLQKLAQSGWETPFKNDLKLFRAQFHLLYGDAS
ncbi:MAG: hypothetical protein HQL52_05540 [Magnetococcales bacterium]|nr:hypothetical protein [Magnetococcales bacterium]